MPDKRDIPHLQDTIAWLLESQTPSIRYLTLTRVKGLPEKAPEVSATRHSISSSPPVTRILAAQRPEGHWMQAKHHYSPKYKSSHWSMLLLTELGLEPENAGLQKGAEFMLAKMEKELPYYLSGQKKGFGCFWGNWLRYQLYCGKGNDARVEQAIEFTCADLERGGQCRYNSNLPCAWGVARGLFGLVLIPESSRDEKVHHAIKAGIRFLLEDHDLLAADYPADRKPHPLWFSLSFPLFYHADSLFVLRVLKELNALDHPDAQKALGWLLEKQTRSGIWRGGSPFSDRTRPFMVKPDGVERWITLHALEVLT
ncbi:MAG: hypothetical protein Q8N39_09565 [Pelolinea sp.]|nr:hypothetical protein [Pelolinea sp.]